MLSHPIEASRLDTKLREQNVKLSNRGNSIFEKKITCPSTTKHVSYSNLIFWTNYSPVSNCARLDLRPTPTTTEI